MITRHPVAATVAGVGLAAGLGLLIARAFRGAGDEGAEDQDRADSEDEEQEQDDGAQDSAEDESDDSAEDQADEGEEDQDEQDEDESGEEDEEGANRGVLSRLLSRGKSRA